MKKNDKHLSDLFISVFSQNNLGIILFWTLICNISPIFGNIFHNNYIDLFFKIISYFAPISLMVIYLIINKTVIEKRMIVIFFIFLFAQILSNFVFVPSYKYINISTFNNIINSALLILVYYILFSNLKLTEKNIIDFCTRYLWFVFLSCIYNIVYNFYDLLNIFSLVNGYSHYFMSYFGNRNTFGLFLVAAILIYYLLNIYVPKYKYYRFFLIFFIFNLLITFSRTSILATIIFLSVYVVLNYKLFVKYNIKKLILYFLVSITLIMIFLTRNNLLNYVIDVFVRPSHILAGRDAIWIYSFNLWVNNNILFGTGNIYYALKLNNSLNNYSCHNIFLTILNRGGIVLFIIYIIIFYKIFIKIKENKNIFLWYVPAFISYIFIGLFESPLLFFNTIYAETIFGIILITLPNSLFFKDNYE